jgi:molecular chaperone HtpG
MFKKDRADFEEKWDDIEIFIHYGMLSDDKFNDKAEKFTLFKNTDGKYFTFDELKDKIKDTQKDKDGKTVVLYTNNVENQHSYIETAQERGYEVLVLESPLTSHLISKLESQNSDFQFARVDADTIDKLIQKEEDLPSKLSEEDQNTLKPVLEKVAGKEKFDVQFASMSEKDAPVLITQSEFMRRMKEQQMAGGGGMQMFGQLPEKYNLVVNSNHKLAQKMLGEKDEGKKEQLAKQAVDLALLAQGLLKGKALTDFVKREAEQLAG